MRNLRAWQEEFFSGPSVFVTEDRDGNLSHIYETREAAEREVRWSRNKPIHRVSVREVNVHTDRTSRWRWDNEPPEEGNE